MSRQSLKRDAGTGQVCAGTGQVCAGPVSSVCEPLCGAVVSPEFTVSPLGSHSEEQLTMSTVIWESWSLPKSGEESLARSCAWSCSEPYSVPTFLHKLQRLCRASSRFCSSWVLSCSSLSFSFLCGSTNRTA